MKLSNLVNMYPGFNPSEFTLEGTNTYVVGSGDSKILIDTGEGIPAWIENISSESFTLQCVLLTHSHPDHIGGLKDVLNHYGRIPVYKRVMHEPEERDLIEKFDTEFVNLEDNQIITTEGATIQAIYTPGHKKDHVSFWLHEENALFAGDLIMGRGSTILDVYADYMISLYKVRNLDPTILYPGHGETNIPAPLKIQESIKHRADRENQVLNAIEFPMNAEEIVNKVYGDLQGKIKAAALSNTSQYLEALKLKSLVELNESKWVRL